MPDLDLESILYLACSALIVLVITIFVVLRGRERKRRDGLVREAMILGLSFEPAVGESFLEECKPFLLFERGARKRAANLMRGWLNGRVEAWLFDYQYTVGSGQHSRTFRQTVALLHHEDAALPRFELKPHDFSSWLSRLFTKEGDKSTTTDPDFDRRYFVSAGNLDLLRVLFTPTLLRQLSERKGWTIEGNGQRFLAYRLGERVKPEGLSGFLRECAGALRLFLNP